MTDFGTDILIGDESFTPVGGRDVLIASIGRRISTPIGGHQWDPRYGSEFRAMLDGPVDAARLRHSAARLEQQLLTDDRIDGAVVRVTYNQALRALLVAVSVTDSDGPFSFVFQLDAAGVARVLE
jgi:phage baseplate assembly protein W